jgi:F-type H+-transporting ATPase subunit alpha
LESELFYTGHRPAVNSGISVSRVGGDAQIKAMKKVSGKIKLELAQYRELQSFAQFGSDVDKDTKQRLDHGERLMEILKQRQYSPIKVEHQVLILYCATNNFLADINIADIHNFETELYDFMDTHYQQIVEEIKEKGNISKELEEKLNSAIEEYKKVFKSKGDK